MNAADKLAEAVRALRNKWRSSPGGWDFYNRCADHLDDALAAYEAAPRGVVVANGSDRCDCYLGYRTIGANHLRSDCQLTAAREEIAALKAQLTARGEPDYHRGAWLMAHRMKATAPKAFAPLTDATFPYWMDDVRAIVNAALHRDDECCGACSPPTLCVDRRPTATDPCPTCRAILDAAKGDE